MSHARTRFLPGSFRATTSLRTRLDSLVGKLSSKGRYLLPRELNGHDRLVLLVSQGHGVIDATICPICFVAMSIDGGFRIVRIAIRRQV